MSRILSDLIHISRCTAQYRTRQLEAFGLTARQASLLCQICAQPGISQEQLSRRVFLNKSVVARALASLEENGFVRRTCCQKDKRITRLNSTEKTLQLLPRLQAIDSDCEGFLIDGMTEQEVSALQNALDRLQSRAAKWTEVD